jgi:tetratricopeptide (TPR) repeat protein
MSWLLALILAGVAASSATAQMLRLRTGKVLIGSVEDANENGLRFKRLDTGGVLDLVWSDLVPDDAKLVRSAKGLVDDGESGDVNVPAMRVRFEKGGAMQDLIAEQIGKDAHGMVLRRKGVRYEVAISDLRAVPEKVEVDIHEVRTPEEIYQSAIEEHQPAEDGRKHMALGLYLIRVGDVKRAKEHLNKAKELGIGDQPRELEAQIERADRLLQNKEEADLIAEIQVMRNRRNFKRAVELAADFEKRFPQGKLKAEFERAKGLLQRDRESWLVQEVANEWYRALDDEAGKIARTAATCDEAKTRAEEALGKAIRERIARTRQITVEEVEKLWGQRLDRRVARVQGGNYSTGSWILGKDVIKGTSQEKAGAGGAASPQAKAQDDQQRRLQEIQKRVEEYMRKARSAGGQGQNQQPELQTEDEWWKDREVSSTTRTLWVKAWYAEKSGDVKVLSVHVDVCPDCGGRGFHEVIRPFDGGTQRIPCATCHQTRFIRSVRFQ